MFALLLQLALAKKVEVPIDVGVGPAATTITGPVAADQPIHSGLAISIEAVLDKKFLRQNKKRIPKQYRSMVMQMDEIRISHPLIPNNLFISPKGAFGGTTGMYGISWDLLGASIPLITEGVRFSVGAGLRFTYAYLHSDTLGQTHFIRPGIAPGAELEIPFSERVLVSVGWNSHLYIPQGVAGPVFDVAPLDESVWHMGEGFLKLHYRIPYKVSL